MLMNSLWLTDLINCLLTLCCCKTCDRCVMTSLCWTASWRSWSTIHSEIIHQSFHGSYVVQRADSPLLWQLGQENFYERFRITPQIPTAQHHWSNAGTDTLTHTELGNVGSWMVWIPAAVLVKTRWYWGRHCTFPLKWLVIYPLYESWAAAAAKSSTIYSRQSNVICWKTRWQI